MRAYERLLRYVKVDTGSREGTGKTPSGEGQKDLAEQLAAEMRSLGFSNVFADEHAYVYGRLPATEGKENVPAIGFIAHLDTSTSALSGGAKPQVIHNYDGGKIALAAGGLTLDPVQFPALRGKTGKTLITTDGTTVLGADDKAGIAEIMTLCEHVMRDHIPHGMISVAFTPDEEIGHGAALLDLKRFGARYAYTVDGSEPRALEFETFNAARAKWMIHGFSVHPGSGKNVMINAAAVAAEIQASLPVHETPRDTEGREGFYHLMEINGTVSAATLDYIIRDHDTARFAARKQKMREIEHAINVKYGAGTAELSVEDEYRNMAEILKKYPELAENAEKAVRSQGFEPVFVPIRGGTDGSQLSFRGLPCPNLGTGGYAFHGPYEYAVAEDMDEVVNILVSLVSEFADKPEGTV